MSQDELDARVYGDVPNCKFGDIFNSRLDLSKAGVHAPTRAGIHGDPSPNGGAFSICISGGYEDDKDDGDKIIYVGSGGRDDSGKQIGHQSIDDGPNQSLKVSSQTKRPVRVIRGADESNHWAPLQGYRYDGLYVVDSFEVKKGKAGYQMCFFELRRIKGEGEGYVPFKRLTTGQLRKINRQAPKS